MVGGHAICRWGRQRGRRSRSSRSLASVPPRLSCPPAWLPPAAHPMRAGRTRRKSAPVPRRQCTMGCALLSAALMHPRARCHCQDGRIQPAPRPPRRVPGWPSDHRLRRRPPPDCATLGQTITHCNKQPATSNKTAELRSGYRREQTEVAPRPRPRNNANTHGHVTSTPVFAGLQHCIRICRPRRLASYAAELFVQACKDSIDTKNEKK